MKRLYGLLLIAALGFILANAHAATTNTTSTKATQSSSTQTKKKPVRYVEQFYYDDEEMFLCAVTNTSTQEVFYGQSAKKKYAIMYARAACQMRSYQGQCFVKAECNWEWVKVRKRRYVRSA